MNVELLASIGGGILTLIYSAWVTYNWTRAIEERAGFREDLLIVKGALAMEQKNREIEKVSYEARLSALQAETLALKRQILETMGVSNALDVSARLHKDDPRSEP